MKEEKAEKGKDASFSRNDEKWWILGMFYCNGNDPLIFVRGRGKGLVLNLGHKAVQIGAIVIVTSIIVLFFVV